MGRVEGKKASIERGVEQRRLVDAPISHARPFGKIIEGPCSTESYRLDDLGQFTMVGGAALPIPAHAPFGPLSKTARRRYQRTCLRIAAKRSRRRSKPVARLTPISGRVPWSNAEASVRPYQADLGPVPGSPKGQHATCHDDCLRALGCERRISHRCVEPFCFSSQIVNCSLDSRWRNTAFENALEQRCPRRRTRRFSCRRRGVLRFR